MMQMKVDRQPGHMRIQMTIIHYPFARAQMWAFSVIGPTVGMTGHLARSEIFINPRSPLPCG